MKEQKHQPDFDRFRRHMKRQSAPGPVPVAEFFADAAIIERMTGEKFPTGTGEGFLDWSALSKVDEKEIGEKVIGLITRFCCQVGLDYTYVELDPGLSFAECVSFSDVKEGERGTWWHVGSQGPIQSWRDFERFPWPNPQALDFRMLDFCQRVVPEDMQIFVTLSGVFDLTSWSMGLENFAIALHEQLDLVEAIVARVSDILAYQVETAIQYERVGGIWLGDDLGFHSGTFIRPEMLRQMILPQHQRLVDLAHREDKLFFLHSCGNLESIMPDIIGMGVDAKHSFEDKILPVEQAYQRWGRQIGIVGGLDMDLMARGSETEVRRRTREILDVCGLQGGYALGTGNSVADYVPVKNFQAMLDEGRKWNLEHFPKHAL